MNLLPFFTITNVLIFVAPLGLAAQAFIGLSFFISCIWEKESRATIFAILQFLGMLAMLMIFLFLVWTGYFEKSTGFAILVTGHVCAAVAALVLLTRIWIKSRCR